MEIYKYQSCVNGRVINHRGEKPFELGIKWLENFREFLRNVHHFQSIGEIEQCDNGYRFTAIKYKKDGSVKYVVTKQITRI